MLPEDGASNEESGEQQNETDQGTANEGQQAPAALTDEQIAQLMQDPRMKRVIQSEADKRTATIERRLRSEQQSQMARLRQRREQDELLDLAEAGDLETLGERTAQRLKEEEELKNYSTRFSGALEGILKEHPEFRALGEDKIEEIYNDVSQRGGNVVDFMVGLATAREQVGIQAAVEQARAGMKSDLEAILAEAGLSRRQSEGGPDPNVSAQRGPTITPSKEDDILGNDDTDVSVLKELLEKRGINPIS